MNTSKLFVSLDINEGLTGEFISALNTFSYQHPIIKAQSGEEETWMLKTIFTTEEPFPTVLRRSEIVETQSIEISPIEQALIEVESRTKELTILNTKFTRVAKAGEQSPSINLLSSGINNTLDASGSSSYRQIFLTPDYLAKFPDRATQIQRLRTAVDDQVRFTIWR